MKFDNKQLWEDFQLALRRCTQETPIELIDNAWSSKGARTEFYFNLLLPKVASKLNLKYETEKVFRVDATFYKDTTHGFHIPIIYIESENDADDTEKEIYKLCCLNAPLKIIFICLEWTESRKKEITTDYWDYIIEAFVKESILVGCLGVIIAEWLDNLKFIGFSYNEDGTSDPEKILLEL